MKVNIRLIYLYLFSFVGLLVVVIGSVRLLELGLKVVVFKGADTFDYSAPKMEREKGDPVLDQARQERETVRQRQRELSGSLAMIAVGMPLYLYHWKTIQKENK
ncbi:MAG: hypothetical protein AAB887_02325 [Patescibacteria group bacterium]